MTKEDDRAITLEDCMALASEVGRLYSLRFDTPDDARFSLMKLSEEVGELTGAWLRVHGQSRGEASRADLADELADVLGFLLVFAAREGIDPAQALQDKWGQYLD